MSRLLRATSLVVLMFVANGSWATELSLELKTTLQSLSFEIPASDEVLLNVIATFQPADESLDGNRDAVDDFQIIEGFDTARFSQKTLRRDAVSRLNRRRQAGKAYVELVAALGGQNVRALPLINAVAFVASRDVIDRVQKDQSFILIRQEAVIEAPFPMAGVEAPQDWNIASIGAPALWQMGYRGGSTVVAVLDTGVDGEHPTLVNSYRGGSNSWLDPYGEHAEPYDRTGHGTQVLGLILGSRTDGDPLGIAPEASWIAAKVFDDAGVAAESEIHEVFAWLLDPDGDPDTDDAPDVVNASWGFASEGLCDDVFQADIDALKAADIAVVFSAGNVGPGSGSDLSPANYANLVSAGAVTVTGEVASYSSRGPSSCDGGLFPKVVAPGDSVETTDHSFGGFENFVVVSGTSFAAAHVSGAIALMRDAIPPAAVLEIESALYTSARDADVAGPDNESGYGLIDLPAALDLLASPNDEDGDGYSDVIDCDDTNPFVYPGAPEKRSDGVDQDCNGYDLTIDVHIAVYSHDGGSLRLRVTSSLHSTAALEVVGVGPLTYQKRRGDWVFNGGGVDGYAQRRITIRGTEGELTVKPRAPNPRRD